MGWYRRLLNGVRPDRLSDDIERELAFHVAERADDLMAGGMQEREALAEARRRFGNYTRQKEQTRAMDLHGWLDTLFADLRYAARALRASPTFAFVAIASLGLGIGANTAIFSLLDAVLLRTLPVRAPEELVRVTEEDSDFGVFTNPLWEELRAQQDVFTNALAYGGARFNLAKGGEVDPVDGAWVSGDFFNTLGVPPAIGRVFTAADDRRGCAPTAVLDHRFWRSRFNGDPAVIGSTLSLSGHDFQVIGVSAPSFYGVEVGTPQHVYVPICSQAIIAGNEVELNARNIWWLRVIGRVKPGLTREQVSARLKQLSPSIWGATAPPRGADEYVKRKFDVSEGAKGSSLLRRQYTRGLTALMIVVATVLLIACANVANLLLARATARQREIAVRLAIGAGRARIIRQLLTESLLLSMLGAAVGVLFALWGNRVLIGLITTKQDPVWLDLSINGRVLGFAIAAAVSDGYFATMSTTLLQGRDFNVHDVPKGPTVAIITESFARRFFGTERAVGKSYRMEVNQEKRPIEIIGVVQDTKYNSLREPMQAVGFIALGQRADAGNSLNFEIATIGDPRALMPRFTLMVAKVHPRASVSYTTLAQQVNETITRERLLATLSGFFGALALLLATIGLYGVISYTMARRRNEIGIRIALGSARGRILRMVMSEVTLVVASGLVVGTGLALASTRLVATLLYGVEPSDPATIVGSAGALAAAALIAGFIPAARAARLDPTIALRDD